MTATLNGMTLPPWASHVEDKLAPMPLLLVQAFVDTLDRDLGTDIFAHADEARAWLADAGLRVPDPGRPDSDFAGDLQLAREARASIRALIGRNTADEPLTDGELAPLEKVLGQAQPRLDVHADGQVRLGAGLDALPARTLADGLMELLLIVRDAQADGTWDRLKLCGNPDCRWAFYDRSHSRRGAWCDMASCGNRVKNRNLRARRAKIVVDPGPVVDPPGPRYPGSTAKPESTTQMSRVRRLWLERLVMRRVRLVRLVMRRTSPNPAYPARRDRLGCHHGLARASAWTLTGHDPPAHQQLTAPHTRRLPAL